MEYSVVIIVFVFFWILWRAWKYRQKVRFQKGVNEKLDKLLSMANKKDSTE